MSQEKVELKMKWEGVSVRDEIDIFVLPFEDKFYLHDCRI